MRWIAPFFLLLGLACGGVTPTSNPDQFWIGTWTSGSNELTISKGASQDDEVQLLISGEAFWFGRNDNVHTGAIEGVLQGRGDQRWVIGEGIFEGCEVRLQRLESDEVQVEDNLKCGGLNVTFAGDYQKKLSTGE